MYKGKFTKDDAGLSAIPDGAALVLMGSAEAAPVIASTRQVVFTEDLTNEQKTQIAAPGERIGLRNLGNTCYFNSVVQSLRRVPELYQFAADTEKNGGSLSGNEMSSKYVQLVRTMNSSTSAVAPAVLLGALRKFAPQFSEVGSSGMMAQQDADECLSELLTAMGKELKIRNNGVSEGDAAKSLPNTRGYTNWTDALFGIGSKTTTTLVDKSKGDVVDTTESSDHMLKLRCQIDGTVNHLVEGIRLGLKEHVTKLCAPLQRQAEYERITTLTDLPPYLFVQLNRFMWRNDTKNKAKILRKVTIPLNLDLFEFTGGELRKNLQAVREEQLKQKELSLAAKNNTSAAAKTGSAASTVSSSTSTSSSSSSSSSSSAAPSSGLDITSENVVSGRVNPNISSKKSDTLSNTDSSTYQLTAVVAHRGREADGGHYVAYVREGTHWYKCDDADVTPATESDVEALCGGGDWQMAYLCMYSKV